MAGVEQETTTRQALANASFLLLGAGDLCLVGEPCLRELLATKLDRYRSLQGGKRLSVDEKELCKAFKEAVRSLGILARLQTHLNTAIVPYVAPIAAAAVAVAAAASLPTRHAIVHNTHGSVAPFVSALIDLSVAEIASFQYSENSRWFTHYTKHSLIWFPRVLAVWCVLSMFVVCVAFSTRPELSVIALAFVLNLIPTYIAFASGRIAGQVQVELHKWGLRIQIHLCRLPILLC